MNLDDLIIVARTIWGEARGETEQGRLAVAWVIKNRVERGGWWGTTARAVCLHPWQFSCWNENDPNRAKLEALPTDDPLFQECLWAALSAFLEKEPDPTDGSCHYKVIGAPASWAAGKVPVCTIGRHQFFNDVE